MSERLSYEELERRVRELEETLERFSRKEQSTHSRLDHLTKLNRIDEALRCSSETKIVLWEVFGQLLDIFQSDRVWILSPSDSGMQSWKVLVERTSPEYPWPRDPADDLAATTAAAEMFRQTLHTPGPVIHGPSGHPLTEVMKRDRTQSQIAMVLRMRRGSPLQFGMHQCSYPRTWSPEERGLFREAGYRISRAMDQLVGLGDRQAVHGVAEREDILDILKAQASLGEALASTTELQCGLELCLAAALEVTGMDSGGIYVFEEERQQAHLACQHNLSGAFIRTVGDQSLASPLGRRIAAGESLYFKTEELPSHLRNALEAEGIRCLAVQPVLSGDRPIACINIASKTKADVPEERRRGLQVISQTAGSAISRIRFGEKLQQAHGNLRALIEHTDDFTMIADEHGRPILWNNAYAAVMKELLGIDMKPGLQPHRLLSDPAAVAWWDELHRRVLGGEKFRVEYTHGEGPEARHFEISYNPILDQGNVNGFSEFTRDITGRRAEEALLRESEKRYRRLVANAPLGIADLSVEGVIQHSNPAHDELFGFEPGEMQGIRLSGLFIERREGARFEENLRRLAVEKAEPRPWPASCLRRDGTPVEIRIDWGYRLDTQGKVAGFSCVFTDVTERRRAQRALRDSEEKFRGFAEESPNMIFIFSADNIIYANRQCERRLGVARSELYGGSFEFTDIIHPDDREKMAAYQRKIAAGKVEEPLDLRLVRTDGETVYTIFASRVIEYRGGTAALSIVTDISSRRKAELALVASEERYRSLVEQSQEAIFTLDSEGRFTLLNPAFEEITGWPVEEWHGKSFMELVHRTHHQDLRTRFVALRLGEKLPPNEVRILTKRGDLVTVEYSSTPIMDDGKFVGVWGIARDITLRQKAEADRRSLAALRERDSVSRWLHDHLGADLYNIVLLADSIQRKRDIGPVVGQQLEWITETSREALASIRNYLDFAGSAGGDFQDLVATIERYGASLLGPLGVDYRFEIRGDLSSVTLTAVQAFNIYLIFKEALTNSIKHAEATRVGISISAGKKTVGIVIEDNGKGMPDEVKPFGHGRLNIKARADELGGELSISPAPDGGTKVAFFLKLKAEGM